MRNYEKSELKRLVLKGLSIDRIEKMGFVRSTIKKYYRWFAPTPQEKIE